MDRSKRINEMLVGNIYNREKDLLNVLAESAQDIASPDRIYFWSDYRLVFDIHYIIRVEAEIYNGCYCVRELNLKTFKKNDWTVFRKRTPSDIVVRYLYEIGGYQKYAEYTK